MWISTPGEAWLALSLIRYKDWRFEVTTEGGCMFLVVTWTAPDTETGHPELQRSRPWHIRQGMTRSELVRTAFLAIRTAEEHELREAFRYREQAIFAPHFDADVLALARMPGA